MSYLTVRLLALYTINYSYTTVKMTNSQIYQYAINTIFDVIRFENVHSAIYFDTISYSPMIYSAITVFIFHVPQQPITLQFY